MLFVRPKRRDLPISLGTKVSQGIGIVPSALKELAFQGFLLLYYNQVLGLPAFYTSIALGIALIIDAVTDPLVGSFSDNFRHKLGRRHPLMFASVVPFALLLYGLFSPPDLDESGLFGWLVVFAVGTRFVFTFYAVPWNALFAEMSDNYQERSELLAWRFAVGWVVGIVFTFSMYSYAFAATEVYPQGQLNPAGYEKFALMLSATVLVAGLLTTWLTLDQVRYLPQPVANHRRFSWAAVKEELTVAFKNGDFRLLFFAVLASGVVGGTNQAMQIYVNTYFWGLTGEMLRWMALTFLGGLLAFLTVVPLQKRVDKKYLLITCAIATIILTAIPVTLRFLNVAPANGTLELLTLLIVNAIVLSYFGTVGLIMFASMVADTVDVQEFQTGLRQEGVFNSAISFSGKVTTAGGILVAGMLIDFVIAMPEAAVEITDEMIFRIGVLDAYFVPAFNVVWLYLVTRYSLTRQRFATIRAVLDADAKRVSN